MLTNWVAGGLDPETFWDQTFATFNAIMIGAAKRTNTLHQIAVAAAYSAECFARTKRLRKLSEYLPTGVQTEAETTAERDAGNRKVLALFRRQAEKTAQRKAHDNG